jgi:hypothetical protein
MAMRPMYARNLQRNLNGTGVRSVIRTGAPIAYKTVNICSLCLSPFDNDGESGLVSKDCHFVIVGFDL